MEMTFKRFLVFFRKGTYLKKNFQKIVLNARKFIIHPFSELDRKTQNKSCKSILVSKASTEQASNDLSFIHFSLFTHYSKVKLC